MRHARPSAHAALQEDTPRRAGFPAGRCAGLSSPATPARATGKSPEPTGSKACPTALTCLDLFCGCGGFTLGMQRAGYHVLAALDFNPQAIATLRANLVGPVHPDLIPVAHALEHGLITFHLDDLAGLPVTQPRGRLWMNILGRQGHQVPGNRGERTRREPKESRRVDSRGDRTGIEQFGNGVFRDY